MSEEKKKDIGYAFRIGAQTAEGITIDITGNFPVNAPNDVINVELDKWVDIFSRQRAKTVLADEERSLEKDKDMLAHLKEDFRLAGERERLKSAEKQAYEGMKQNIARITAQIEAREKGIVSLKALL